MLFLFLSMTQKKKQKKVKDKPERSAVLSLPAPPVNSPRTFYFSARRVILHVFYVYNFWRGQPCRAIIL
jgi:hypothetical protein